MVKKSRKHKPKKQSALIATGVIRMHHRGFGFVHPEENDLVTEDIFIPKQYTATAIDGDFVEVRLNPRPSEKGPDGVVTKILKRGRSQIGGTIVQASAKKMAYAFAPLLGRENQVQVIQPKDAPLKEGDRIIIKILSWGSKKELITGQMHSYIGNISDPTTDVRALIEEYELASEFPTQVIEEARSWGEAVSAHEIKNRLDLRKLETITIDPDTAKDFDDALSLHMDGRGNYQLVVHIADVSHYVKPNSYLDIEARTRCNSVYFPGGVLPMLPHELSSHLCSLKPHVNRLAISIFITLDPTGTVLDYKIARSVIKSAHRFTYKEALEVLEGRKKSKHVKTLELMADLCKRLKKKRAERGCIEFAVPSVAIQVDDKGVPLSLEFVDYDITHQLVEEFMLKANEIIATHLSKANKKMTYRIHDEPNVENMRDFANLARVFGFSFSDDMAPAEIQAMFDTVRASPLSSFLATAFIKSMKLATYSTENIGHFGLGLEYYTHFTSPIRRYIDLVVHRILFEENDPRQDLDKVALTCSEKERQAAKAEGSAILIKKIRFLMAHHSKNPRFNYAAIITDIKPFGIIFEVKDFFVEGVIALSSLDDYYVYNEIRGELKGKRSGKVYKLGETISVRLVNLNLVTQQTEWQLSKGKR